MMMETLSRLSPLQPDAPWWLRRYGLMSLIGATVLHLVASGLLFFLVRAREDIVILRYNAYLGVDLLGAWWQIFLVPGVTYFFVLTNVLLLQLLDRRGYSEVALLFALGNWFISGATLIVAVALSFINI